VRRDVRGPLRTLSPVEWGVTLRYGRPVSLREQEIASERNRFSVGTLSIWTDAIGGEEQIRSLSKVRAKRDNRAG